ncbi:MRG-domain-containing protein [Metschnikowia bicuspidata var. bicuspidata NRRL YB-4993]|uniref:Chromatin modification-related protein EAF3 n=1 Tax=Metschnikowia bicuspidata var. bicuspidata NRRL YB-4993 TaxID=869754 RepID=A0A1A0H9X6_9ASCO|nr:MRG-domain-containing protein [Metschnikowia bicuspidata var. bicuspidata NRRL YB-4993]OBA20934.1 MRG-domain-containing protein [Metschnikowia bicuspidata var. bicuspidata NRRL YB-4993]
MVGGPQNFIPGSKVLAYHGPLVYEAKVLKYHKEGLELVDVEEEKSEPLDKNKIPGFLLDKNAYFLHYKGWNPKWDEWVSSERIIEFNDDNLGLSRELRNARKKTVERLDSGKEAKAEAAEQKSRRGRRKNAPTEASTNHSGPSKDQSKPNSNGRKRQKTEPHAGYEVMLPFSPRLKCVMVDDWELITKDRKLVNLETVTPVLTILKEYYEWKRAGQSIELTRTTEEALSGLKILFDQTFGLDLLYKFERLQYSELFRTRKNFEPSNVYGCEHLLRLIITLPGRVSQTVMDAMSVNIMMGQMSDLLEYIDANMATLGSSYMNVSSQYDRVARM